MAEARCRTQWDRTAAVLALLANVHRKKGASPVRPEQLNPYRRVKRTRGMRITTENLHLLKDAFVSNKERTPR